MENHIDTTSRRRFRGLPWLAPAVVAALVTLSACDDGPLAAGGDGGSIPGWPDAERMTYDLVTDCLTTNPEEFCGEFIELKTNGYGGYLPGGDVIEGIQWSYKSDEVIEIRLEDDDEAINDYRVVGAELHEVGTDRVFVSDPAEEEEAEAEALGR